jgi:pyrroline-5-carboxylate reductase
MKYKRIAVIGGGNLGSAIAEGLIKTALTEPKNIYVTRRNTHLLKNLREQGIKVTSDNVQAVQNSEIIILAIKPKKVAGILKEIAPYLESDKHILVSVVTGLSVKDMQTAVGEEVPIFRAMPNTAIAIQESMTCVSTKNGTAEQQETILALFKQLGEAVLIEDDLMAAATVLGACGIAYSMRYIRAASQGGIEIGFNAETALLVAAQMVKGAACLILQNGQHPEQEIDKVTTPQGCTIVGLNEMEHQGFSSALIKGIVTSYHKIGNISEEYNT